MLNIFKSRMFYYHATFFCSIYLPNATFVFYHMSNVIWHVFFVITPRNTHNKCLELEVGICLKSRLINNQVNMQTNDARKSSLRRIVYKQIPKSLKNCTTNVYNPGIKVNISVIFVLSKVSWYRVICIDFYSSKISWNYFLTGRRFVIYGLSTNRCILLHLLNILQQ